MLKNCAVLNIGMVMRYFTKTAAYIHTKPRITGFTFFSGN